jgi:hypothetical protein
MINSVRNTVIAILNKNNYGYFSPSDYNLYAKQAQLEIFENLFYDFNYYINKVNARQSGTGNADIKKQLEEEIDTFSATVPLDTVIANVFQLPDDYFLLNVVFVTATNKEVEKVTHDKIRQLLASDRVAPTTNFPAYTLQGDHITIYPVTFITDGDVSLQYIRYPKDPKWTYFEVTGSEPVYNQSAADHQDFELSLAFEPRLVSKILGYAGVTIREAEVVQFMQMMEEADKEDKV